MMMSVIYVGGHQFVYLTDGPCCAPLPDPRDTQEMVDSISEEVAATFTKSIQTSAADNDGVDRLTAALLELAGAPEVMCPILPHHLSLCFFGALPKDSLGCCWRVS